MKLLALAVAFEPPRASLRVGLEPAASAMLEKAGLETDLATPCTQNCSAGNDPCSQNGTTCIQDCFGGVPECIITGGDDVINDTLPGSHARAFSHVNDSLPNGGFAFHVVTAHPVDGPDGKGASSVTWRDDPAEVAATQTALPTNKVPPQTALPTSKVNYTRSEPRRIPPKLLLVSKYASIDDLPATAKANEQRLLALNPDLEVTWLDDRGCADMLATEAEAPVRDVFIRAKAGKYRSDLCRAVWLYHNGGFYVDTDVEMRVPFRTLVAPDTSFLSSWPVMPHNKYVDVLNAFIGVEPKSEILKQTVDAMVANPDSKYILKSAGKKTDAAEWGPETLGTGLQTALTACGKNYPKRNLFETPYCTGNLRMYHEINMREPDALSKALVEPKVLKEAYAQEDRSKQKTGGLAQYGIFKPGPPGELVAYSRFAGCEGPGCGLDG